MSENLIDEKNEVSFEENQPIKDVALSETKQENVENNQDAQKQSNVQEKVEDVESLPQNAEVVENDNQNKPNFENENKEIDFDDKVVSAQMTLIKKRQVATVLSNVSIACIALCIFFIVGGILSLLAKIGFILIVGTLLVGLAIVTIFAIVLSEGYKDAWRFLGEVLNGEELNNIINFLFSLIPYISVVGAVVSVLSIGIMATAKSQKSKARIIVNSICIVGFVIIFVFAFGGKK